MGFSHGAAFTTGSATVLKAVAAIDVTAAGLSRVEKLDMPSQPLTVGGAHRFVTKAKVRSKAMLRQTSRAKSEV
jgi:hypothetical protein